METASRYGSKPEAYSAATAEDVSIHVALDGDGPRMGSDADLSITFTNGSSEQRSVILHSQVAVMYYTGVHKATLRRDRTQVDLPPDSGEPQKASVLHTGMFKDGYSNLCFDDII